MSEKIKVVWLSDSPFFVTGYSTISKNICNALADAGMEVHYLANGYSGQTLAPGIKLEEGFELKYTIHGQGREAYFKDLIEYKIKELKADVFVVLLDTFMLYPWLTQLDFSPAKTLFYFPSDGGGGLPLGCDQILRKMNYSVAMAEFGQQQVKKVHDIVTGFIPHGVDVKNFYPLPHSERTELRKKWGLEGKFVIGCVARNQGRKMMDRAFKIMKLYAKENPNAILLLHSDPNDNAAVFPMTEMIKRYGLENRVRFTGMNFYKGYTYKEMNAVYNVMDVFLLPTSGEGFGVPIIEAMACQIPCLVTDYTTTDELVKKNKSGFGINLVGTTEEENVVAHGDEIIDGTICGSWMVERGICSCKDAVVKLKLLEDEKLRKEFGINGRKAVLEKYDWNVINPQWVKIIKQLGESI